METVIGKLRADVDTLEKRVKAKEAILKGVFSSLEDTSADRQMIREVLSVNPKTPASPTHVSLEQSWCVGFEDTVCVSFTASNNSERYYMQPVCHLLEGCDSVVRCVVLDEHGSCTPFIRANSSADLLVGLSKSAFFTENSCVLLLEFIHQPLSDRTCDGAVLVPMLTQPGLPPMEVHTLSVAAPRTWYSFADFISAKEHDMLLLLRCLKVGSYTSSLRPTSSFEFAEANPDFDCCDFGDWQVFVGHKLFDGLVAVSSTFDQPNANIDRIYGRNPGLLEQFVRKCSKQS